MRKHSDTPKTQDGGLARIKVEKIKAILEGGIKGHPLEKKLRPQLHWMADRIGKTFAKVLGEEETELAAFVLNIKPREGREAKIVYGTRRRRGRHDGDPWFPFPHDHCYLEFCFIWVTKDLEEIEVCVELELPCRIEWPW